MQGRYRFLFTTKAAVTTGKHGCKLHGILKTSGERREGVEREGTSGEVLVQDNAMPVVIDHR